MSVSLQTLSAHVSEALTDKIQQSQIALNELTIELLPEDLLEISTFLRDDAVCGFEQLIDVCGVDYLAYGESEWDVGGSSFSRWGKQRVFI